MPDNTANDEKWFRAGLLLLVFSLTAGCATTSPLSVENDPYEEMNRSILDFNLYADRKFFKPAAESYRETVPAPVRKGIGNFFSNLWEPMTVVNDLLQGKLDDAIRDTGRFLINTTIGVLGIFDVADKMGLPRHKEDFGQTLAVWGIPSGPYLVLPFLGPSNLRDAAGLAPQFAYADMVSYLDSPEVYYVSGIRLTDTRSQLLGADELLEAQPDPYLFLRQVYEQSRTSLIQDGSPPLTEGQPSEDELIDQLLQDDQ